MKFELVSVDIYGGLGLLNGILMLDGTHYLLAISRCCPTVSRCHPTVSKCHPTISKYCPIAPLSHPSNTTRLSHTFCYTFQQETQTTIIHLSLVNSEKVHDTTQ